MLIESIIIATGLGLGIHFRNALEKSGKETFTKEDLILIHTNAIISFCADFRNNKKKEEEQKSKEAKLSK